MSKSEELEAAIAKAIANSSQRNGEFISKISEEQWWAEQGSAIDSIEDKKQRIERWEEFLKECFEEKLKDEFSFQAYLKDLMEQYELEQKTSEHEQERLEGITESWGSYLEQGETALLSQLNKALGKALDLISRYDREIQQLGQLIGGLKAVKAALLEDISKLSADIKSDYSRLYEGMGAITFKLPRFRAGGAEGLVISISEHELQSKASPGLLEAVHAGRLTVDEMNHIEKQSDYRSVEESIIKRANAAYQDCSVAERNAFVATVMKSPEMKTMLEGVHEKRLNARKNNPLYESILQNAAISASKQRDVNIMNTQIESAEKRMELAEKNRAKEQKNVDKLRGLGAIDERPEHKENNNLNGARNNKQVANGLAANDPLINEVQGRREAVARPNQNRNAAVSPSAPPQEQVFRPGR